MNCFQQLLEYLHLWYFNCKWSQIAEKVFVFTFLFSLFTVAGLANSILIAERNREL